MTYWDIHRDDSLPKTFELLLAEVNKFLDRKRADATSATIAKSSGTIAPVLAGAKGVCRHWMEKGKCHKKEEGKCSYEHPAD